MTHCPIVIASDDDRDDTGATDGVQTNPQTNAEAARCDGTKGALGHGAKPRTLHGTDRH
jgi:hypothetical protein